MGYKDAQYGWKPILPQKKLKIMKEMNCKNCGKKMLRTVGADKENRYVNSFICPGVTTEIAKTNLGHVIVIYCEPKK